MSIGYSNNSESVTLPATADYSAKQFHAMKISSGKAAIGSVEGELTIGILTNDPAAANRAASIQTSGTAQAVAGTGGVTNGDKCTTATDGRLVTTTTSGHYVLGVALETASVGEQFALLIDKFIVP